MSKGLAAVVQFVELVGGAGGDGFGRVVTPSSVQTLWSGGEAVQMPLFSCSW